MVKDTGRNPCHFNHAASRKLDAVKFHSMSAKLLTEHNLEFLSLKGGCTGSFESTHDILAQCWKLHVAAQLMIILTLYALLDSSFWFDKINLGQSIVYILRRKSLVSTDTVCNNFVRQS